MKYSISPGALVDRVQDLGDQLDNMQEFAGELPDFMNHYNAGEIHMTKAAIIVGELLHALVMANMKMRLLRAEVRES